MPASTTSDRAEAGLVLGTAGHIDHGKTALVGALTGVDTDRLPEEKARGITLELGFAPLDLPEGARLSVVDVPGHEKLVRTMVAGAAGIDLVLLVVAADEGVMPQTREHAAICDLLGIRHGVVALTKIDLVSADVVGLAREEVGELLQGTGLEGARCVPVSARAGEGLDELRAALAEAAAAADPRTPRAGPPRLFVDRAFTARGFGCVVTGTLTGGAFQVGDRVVLQPSQQPARVRGLQSHGQQTRRRGPGVRCAVNLQGIELREVRRGELLTHPGALRCTATLDARLHWLASAPPLEEPRSVELLLGAAVRRARAAPIGAALAPGARGFARLHIEAEPLPALPGDRFVLRGFARTELGATLGGGCVLDVAPPHRRRSDPRLAAELEVLDRLDPVSGLALRVERAGFRGVSAEQLAQETGLGEIDLAAALAELRQSGRALEARRSGGSTWIQAEALAALSARLREALERFHRAEPLQPGMASGALRGCLPGNVPPEIAESALHGLVERGEARVEADRVRRPDHEVALPEAEQRLAERIAQTARAAGLEPPAPRDWAEQLGATLPRFRELAGYLERAGRLVRAPGELWFDAEAVAALRRRVSAHLDEHGRLTTPEYKALIGTTRRTAVPLMELLDAEHLTIRRGEARFRAAGSRSRGASG